MTTAPPVSSPRHRLASFVVPFLGAGLVLLCCALPLGWLLLQIVADPITLRLLRPAAVRWDILGRTCGYSAVAAVLAVGLAVPAGVVVGRRGGGRGGSGSLGRLVTFALPVTLLLPSLAYAYGWAQFFRLIAGPLGCWLVAADLDPAWLDAVGVSVRTAGPDAPAAFLVSAGPADVARCVGSLAAWLWPIPAAAMAWALRQVDPAVREQARLDGASRRLAARQLLAPALVGGLAVWVLASQEFAVYEPTGISVVATEVRMVFETGAFSSSTNPITQPMGGGLFTNGGGAGDSAPTAGGTPTVGGPPAAPWTPQAPWAAPPGGVPTGAASPIDPRDTQQRAAAAAVATGVPMMLLAAAAGAVLAAACRRWSTAGEDVQEAAEARRPMTGSASVLRRRRPLVAWTSRPCAAGRSKRTFDFEPSTAGQQEHGRDAHATGLAGRVAAFKHAAGLEAAPVAASFVLLLTVGVPVASMVLRHHRPFDVWFVWRQSGELVLGSLFMAALAGLAAAGLAAAAAHRRPRWALAVALAAFLVGGQLLAIALIRLYNRPGLGWVYNGPPIIVMAYAGRFGWLALLAAAATWTRPWRQLRAAAAVDGADPAAVARHVVGPLAWPLVAGSGLLVLVLSLTEVPATVLAAPYRPPQIVPMLMTWVHVLESDPMIEASLLLVAVVVLLGGLVNVLFLLARRRFGTGRSSGLDPALADAGSHDATGALTQHPRTAVCGLPGNVQILLVASVLTLALTSAGGCGEPGVPEAVWMSTGTAPGQVVYPRGICYSRADDSFFVVDRVARIQHLDHDGNVLGGWQMPEWAVGKPVGISVGPDGNVYVPDTHYHRVMVYSPAGQLLRQWGTLGKEPGQFIFPTDVAFDDKGRVFVSEYGDNDRVQVFDGGGRFLYQFGKFGNGDGEFARPQSIVVDKGLLYAADAGNHRLCVFTTDGAFVRNMGSVGSDPGQFRFPYGLELDPDGRLVVTEFGNNRVQLVDKETGKGLKTWGTAGREPGHLAYPWAATVDKRGRVVAVDSGNNRLQVFEF